MNNEELFEKYVSATLSEAECESLKVLLRDDPRAARDFACYVDETALMVSVAEESQQQQVPEGSANNRTRRPQKRRESALRLAIKVFVPLAAMLVIGAYVLVDYVQNQKAIGEVAVAVQVERNGAIVTLEEKQLVYFDDKVSSSTDGGRLKLLDGSTVTLSKGATCQVSKSTHGFEVSLKNGRGEFEVSSQKNGKSFIVMTPLLRTTVIGTHFTVDADDKTSRVRVLEGLVKVDDLKNEAHFVEPGELAVIEKGGVLSKKNAQKAMGLAPYLCNAQGEDCDVEYLESKNYIVLLYAQKWDPSSRSFVLQLMEFYKKFPGDYEVIFMDAEGDFSVKYKMPWLCVKDGMEEEVAKLLGPNPATYPLNLVILDQEGKVLKQAAKGSKWHGTDSLLLNLKKL